MHQGTAKTENRKPGTVSFSRLGKQGRLGNQLFQIAMTYALARDHGMAWALPEWEYTKYFARPDIFPCRKQLRFDGEVGEAQFHYTPYTVDRAARLDLSGFFQSEKYFAHYAEDIRRMFRFRENLITSPTPPSKGGESQPHGPRCAIHVRRGDYLANASFLTLGMDYYNEAIAEVEAHCPGVQFVVFSDDIGWCKRNFTGAKFTFSEGLSDIEDLALMTRCNHFIMSASTFSWWGAWLGEKDLLQNQKSSEPSDFPLKGTSPTRSLVIAPDTWFGPAMTYDTRDVIPERWRKIPVTPKSPERDLSRLGGRKIKLPQVTLVAMACDHVPATIKALEYSMRGIEFGAVKLLTHFSGAESAMSMDPDDKLPIDIYHIKKTTSLGDWCRKAVYELPQYIETEYALLVHRDGFVVNPLSWQYEWLDYDYTGAPWPSLNHPIYYRDRNGEEIRVGNSVSLRSKRLLDLPNQLGMPWEKQRDGTYHEDTFICIHNRHLYLEAGMKFAPLEVAKYFSHETMIPEVKGIRPFCFHKWAGTNAGYPKFEDY